MTKSDVSLNKRIEYINRSYSFKGLKRVFEYYDKKQPIMVSVIINCFNHSRYIEECIRCVLNQFVDFNVEILVHDDCSNDGSQAIISRLADKYPNIVLPLFQNENMYSKNIKITNTFQLPRARGKYIAFCEGDDCWMFDSKLINQIHFLEEHQDYSSSGHNTYVKVGDRNALFCENNNECDLNTINALDWDEKLRIHYSSIVIKTEIAMKEKPNYYYSISNVGDRSLVIFASENGKIKYFPFVGSLYRKFSTHDSWSYKNEKSISGQLSIQSNLALFYGELEKHFNADLKLRNHCNKLKNESLYNYYFLKGDFNYISRNDNLLEIRKAKSFAHRFYSRIARILPFAHKLYLRRALKI